MPPTAAPSAAPFSDPRQRVALGVRRPRRLQSGDPCADDAADEGTLDGLVHVTSSDGRRGVLTAPMTEVDASRADPIVRAVGPVRPIGRPARPDAARRGRSAALGVAGHEGRVDLLEHDLGVDHAPLDVVAARAGRT